MNKRPIIIDCDPGVDDTIAIFLAASYEGFDIKAINPVAGNVGYGMTSQNALRLASMLKLNCRVGVGADKPLFKPMRTAGAIHGEGGLGGYILPKPDRDFDKAYAWDIMYEEAVKAGGELEVIVLGPLTNVAIAILRYPQLKTLIKRIVFMGGSAHYGNMSAYAEFNIWVDPDACDVVLRSGIPLAMCGLDGNFSAGYTKQEVLDLKSEGSLVSDVMNHIVGFFIEEAKDVPEHVFVINDAITMAYFIDENIAAEIKPCHVACETRGRLTAGQTIVSDRGDKNCEVLIKADKALYSKMIFDMINYYK